MPPGWELLQYFDTYKWHGPFFGVRNFEIQYFWGLSEKLIFWGYEEIVDIFGGHYLNELIWGYTFSFS